MNKNAEPALRLSRLFFILIIFSILLTTKYLLSQEVFPSWFKKLPTPPSGYRFSVGYAGKYINKDLGKLAALENAFKNLYKQDSIRLKFRLEEISDGRMRITHPSFIIIYDSSKLNWNVDYKIVDSLYTDKSYFVLIISPSDINVNVAKRILNDWEEKPDWVKLKTEKDKNIGIGIVSNYISWVRAWQDADDFSYFDLAKAKELNANSIHTKRFFGFLIESKIIKQDFDTILRNCVVIERWYDKTNDIYYSLCVEY